MLHAEFQEILIITLMEPQASLQFFFFHLVGSFRKAAHFLPMQQISGNCCAIIKTI